MLLFSFKGDVIVANPLTIVWIAVPLFIQTMLVFGLGFALARLLRLSYEDAAPAAMIGASNHFEVAIATATGKRSQDPARIRNSPTKPDVPGSPAFAIANRTMKPPNIGMVLITPP